MPFLEKALIANTIFDVKQETGQKTPKNGQTTLFTFTQERPLTDEEIQIGIDPKLRRAASAIYSAQVTLGGEEALSLTDLRDSVVARFSARKLYPEVLDPEQATIVFPDEESASSEYIGVESVIARLMTNVIEAERDRKPGA
jgi:hypothetical protein